MAILDLTKTYFELCDATYENWKAYSSHIITTVTPYWESLRK